MSDRINLLRRVSSLDMSPEFDGVTKLICNIVTVDSFQQAIRYQGFWILDRAIYHSYIF